MTAAPATQPPLPLTSLRSRFRGNIAALQTRDSRLADRLLSLSPTNTYHILADANAVRLAIKTGSTISPLPNPIDPTSAARVVMQMQAAGQLSGPVLVAGLDHGWLWSALAQVDIKTPSAPGHRLPLYLLAPDLERLWAVVHLHDWRTMLADRRCLIFAGDDAAAQFQDYLIEHVEVGWPRAVVTTDPSIWPAGSHEPILAAADAEVQRRVNEVIARLSAVESRSPSDDELSERFRSGAPLRVLGITSRYTTFLQYSMRDWLAGMESLGHTTRLLIEQHDHEKPHQLIYLRAIKEFEPDLIVLIDHYRAELPHIPAHIPCVMWVQDRLPNIFCAAAGAAQGRRDYCLGFGRLELSSRFGYPADRFMPAQVGVNVSHFSKSADNYPPGREHEKLACDICYVAHASQPASSIVAEVIRQQPDPLARRLIEDVFEQICERYQGERSIAHAQTIRDVIAETCIRLQIEPAAMQIEAIYDFFNNRVHNALFRHQALEWICDFVEASPGKTFNLWGNGWNSHPRFAPYARGPADNRLQLPAIYRASRINLQITPHGAIHQRLLEGLAAGGFFLIRYCAGDVVEPVYRQIWDWCQTHHVLSDAQLRVRADQNVRCLLQQLRDILGVDPFQLSAPLMDVMRLSADSDYIRSAASIWPDEYPQVAFHSRTELHNKLRHYLSNDAHREDPSASMRRAAIERFSYEGLSRRLLDFIARDMAPNVAVQPEGALAA